MLTLTAYASTARLPRLARVVSSAAEHSDVLGLQITDVLTVDGAHELSLSVHLPQAGRDLPWLEALAELTSDLADFDVAFTAPVAGPAALAA